MIDPEKPVRKKNRLASYDYSEPGAYFVTVCTRGREKLLWDPTIVGAAISRPPDEHRLPCAFSDYGRIVDQAICNLPEHYPHILVDQYVVMPNHIHLLLSVSEMGSGRLIAAPTLSTVIGQMKRWASREAGISLWQKSFYEHVIRDQEDYLAVWNYIYGNPAKWSEDIYFST